MNEVYVKDFVSISIYGFLSKVVSLAKIWIGEFWSVKLVKVRIVHFFIMFETHHIRHAHLTVRLRTSSLEGEVGVVNLTVLLLFVCWTCSDFQLNCYFLYDWTWRTFVKIVSLQRISPFPKWTFHAPSIVMRMQDEGRLSLPFSSWSGPQIQTHVTMPMSSVLIKFSVNSVPPEWFSLSVSAVTFQDFTYPPFKARLHSKV